MQLHKKLMTRELTPEDQSYFLERDLAKLRAASSSLDQQEIQLSNAKKQADVKREAMELQARRTALKRKYAV